MVWKPGPDEALLCVAILARDADGIVRSEETDYIATQLAPGLQRLGYDGQMVVVAALAVSLKEQGIDPTLTLLRAALPPHQLPGAVELALEVALADRHLDPREAQHVAHVAKAFGLDEAGLARVLQVAGAHVEGGRHRFFSGKRASAPS